MRRGDLLRALESGALLDRLAPVYGKDAPSAAYRLRELAPGLPVVYCPNEDMYRYF